MYLEFVTTLTITPGVVVVVRASWKAFLVRILRRGLD